MAHNTPQSDSLSAEQLAAILRQRLATYIPGSRLPGREQLARHFECSEHAVRGACDILAAEGLLLARHRGGMFVQASTAGPRLREIHVLLTPRPVPLYQETVLLGIDQQCQHHRLRMTVNRHPPDLARPDCLDRLADGNPQEVGWALLSTSPPQSTMIAWRLAGIPFVMIDEHTRGVVTNRVDLDAHGAMYQAAERLIRLGHRRIAFAGRHEPSTQVSRDRVEGFALALQRHGLEIDPSLLLVDTGKAGSTRKSVADELAAHDRPRMTAFVVADQRMGCETLTALNEAGLDVPGDVSVIAGGASLRLPPDNLQRLSVYDEGPPQSVGQVAVDVLVNSASRTDPQTVLLGCKWIDRGSAAPPLE